MALNPAHLVVRQPVIDAKGNVAYFRLSMAQTSPDVLMPFMLRLGNIEQPEIPFLLPITWAEDEVILIKLSHDIVLTASVSALKSHVAEKARQRGFRLAATLTSLDPRQPGSDLVLVPFTDRHAQGLDSVDEDGVLELHIPDESEAPQPIKPAKPATEVRRNRIYTGVDIRADRDLLQEDASALYFCGDYYLDCPIANSGKIAVQPAHAVILEMMAAVQKEADPKALDDIAKRDVTLSFKLLRFVNSASFGLSRKVESVRHAATILGYDQLQKWLSLLAITAGSGASPALTLTAMTRAKLMELLGKNMERKDQDNLFITGMFSMLDRIMGIPMERVMTQINLPENVTNALLNAEGKYRRYLDIALACEGAALPEDENFSDIDVKNVNVAHLEAMEWAARLAKTHND